MRTDVHHAVVVTHGFHAVSTVRVVPNRVVRIRIALLRGPATSFAFVVPVIDKFIRFAPRRVVEEGPMAPETVQLARLTGTHAYWIILTIQRSF